MVMRSRMTILQPLLVLVVVVVASISASSVHTEMVMCRSNERDALLSFKMAFSIDNRPNWVCGSSYAKTGSWSSRSNCCEWDGVTCDSITGHVVKLDLGCSLLAGSFPSNNTLFLLPHLRHLNLSSNYLSGQVPREIGRLSHLTTLDLSLNHQLKMPNFEMIITNLTNLRVLDLSFISLASHLPQVIYDFSNLTSLGLAGCVKGKLPSTNVSSSMLVESRPCWPTFDIISLSSCNLGHFPGFLRKQADLTWLDLSNNVIYGVVPNWILSLGTLRHLNISYNMLHGGLENLPWKSMDEIDIQCNLFHGAVPVPSPYTRCFRASSNQFAGDIPPSLCDIGELGILDLANNNLRGNIPDCFASLIANGMKILDLKKNQLQGAIPSFLFQKCPYLITLSLSENSLEGPIPQSVSNCLRLQLLDLSSNNLNDTFPHWLGILPSLEVLILGSNNLHGSIMAPNTMKSFSRLLMLDISNNDFTGNLPGNLLRSMKAMMKIDNTFSFPHLGLYGYQDSITLWIGGFTRRLDGIDKMLVYVDASKNRLEGPIPEVIGDLVFLQGLNLADNNFTGLIPNSLSKLSRLEWLDLSFNRLEGGIPNDLVNLYFLGYFNVSENGLSGPIPTGIQFSTFDESSYLGNPDLSGPWPTNESVSDASSNSTTYEGSSYDSSDLQVWEISLIGLESGIFAGLAWGYLIFWEYTPYWVERLIFQVEALTIVHMWKARQNRRR